LYILIADNTKEIVALLQDVLRQKGHEVDTAFDGKEAHGLLEGHVYDLVILDHDMPEITGIELVKLIRAGKCPTKIVMITGYPTIQDFFIKALGADEYIPKPFTMDQIYAVIKKYDKKNTA